MEEIKMNKTELVAAVAAKAELSKKDAEAAINARNFNCFLCTWVKTCTSCTSLY